MRFAVHVDGFTTNPDILNPTSITTMTTVSTATGGSGYAKGWVIDSDKNWFHVGGLPGTRSDAAGHAGEVDVWPTYNLF